MSYSLVGETCPGCSQPIEAGADVHVCSACQRGYHRDCYFDGGGCVVPGCSGGSTEARATKDCPYCGEEILLKAVRCRHCQSDLSPMPSASPAAAPGGSGIDSGASLRFGLDALMGHLGFLIVLQLAAAMLYIVPYTVAGALTPADPVTGAVLYLADLLLSAIVTLGLLRIWLNITDGKAVSFADLFSLAHRCLSYLVLMLIVGIIVTLGFVLLVIPGIIWSLQFMFAGHAMADRNVGAFEAMAVSSDLTRGRKLELFGFSLLLILINGLGALLLGIGLLVTMPLTALALTYVYRSLEA